MSHHQLFCPILKSIIFYSNSHDSVDDVKLILENHRSSVLSNDVDDIFRITVRRSHIWDDALRAVRRNFDESKHIRITFLGESAIDGGGPRREFFMLLMNSIKENNSLLEGPSNSRVVRHNTAALQDELYLSMGKMIALSVVHGGPGQCSFHVIINSQFHFSECCFNSS